MMKQSKSTFLKLKNTLIPTLTSTSDLIDFKKSLYEKQQASNMELEEIERLTKVLYQNTEEEKDSPIFIIYNDEYIIEHVGSKVSESLGFHPEEIVGSSLLNMFNCSWSKPDKEELNETSPEKRVEELIYKGNFPSTAMSMINGQGKLIGVKLSGLLSHDANGELRKGIIFGTPL